MRGTTAPKQKGAHPLSGNPLMYYFDWGRKIGHFLTTFLKRKNSVWGLNSAFFSLFEGSKRRRGGGKKPSKHVYMREKVKAIKVRTLAIARNELVQTNNAYLLIYLLCILMFMRYVDLFELLLYIDVLFCLGHVL
jgi:hypothetical protein